MDEGAATGRDPKEDHELLKNKNLRRRRRRPGRHSAKTIPLQHHQVTEKGVVLLVLFMVNKMSNWDEVTKRGNPTSCTKINALIGLLIKMEVA